MGTKIKDAQLLESVTGAERIPVSDGSGNPKAVTIETLSNVVFSDSVKIFQTQEEYENALDSIEYPCLSYIEELNKCIFSEKPIMWNAHATVTQEYINTITENGVISAVNGIPICTTNFLKSCEVDGIEMIGSEVNFQGVCKWIVLPLDTPIGTEKFLKITFDEEKRPTSSNQLQFGSFTTMTCIDKVVVNKEMHEYISTNGSNIGFPVLFLAGLNLNEVKFVGNFSYGEVYSDLKSMFVSFLEQTSVISGEKKFLIPTGDSSYGNSTDMWDGSTQSGYTWWGVYNKAIESLGASQWIVEYY